MQVPVGLLLAARLLWCAGLLDAKFGPAAVRGLMAKKLSKLFAMLRADLQCFERMSNKYGNCLQCFERIQRTIEQAAETIEQAAETIEQIRETIEHAAKTIERAAETFEQI